MSRSAPDDGLRGLIRTNIVGPQWTAVETGATTQGVPDLYGLLPGRPGIGTWIECKRTEAVAVTMRPLQVGWLLTHARMGGQCFVAVRKRCEAGRRRLACDELWIYPGSMAKEIQNYGLAAPPTAVWKGGPGQWRWHEVELLLRARLSYHPRAYTT